MPYLLAKESLKETIYPTFSSVIPKYQSIVEQLEHARFGTLYISSIILSKPVITNTDQFVFLLLFLYRHGTETTAPTYKLKSCQC